VVGEPAAGPRRTRGGLDRGVGCGRGWGWGCGCGVRVACTEDVASDVGPSDLGTGHVDRAYTERGDFHGYTVNSGIVERRTRSVRPPGPVVRHGIPLVYASAAVDDYWDKKHARINTVDPVPAFVDDTSAERTPGRGRWGPPKPRNAGWSTSCQVRTSPMGHRRGRRPARITAGNHLLAQTRPASAPPPVSTVSGSGTSADARRDGSGLRIAATGYHPNAP
jgi:hypothetical protein